MTKITTSDVRRLYETDPAQTIVFDFGMYRETMPASEAWPMLRHRAFYRTGQNRMPDAIYIPPVIDPSA